MTRIDPDEARRWLPTYVAQLYEANRYAAAVLTHKASILPSSTEARAFAALEQARRAFDAWAALAGGPLEEKSAALMALALDKETTHAAQSDPPANRGA